MEISIIFDIFTVFLLALLRLGRILPGFFATLLPHMVGKPRPSMTDATVKEIVWPSYRKANMSLEDTLTFLGVRFDLEVFKYLQKGFSATGVPLTR